MTTEEQFLDRLQKFIKENKLIKAGDTLLIGFSGGADSTALLHSLLSLRYELGVSLLAAHVNYHLRGDESEADMNYVKEFCFQHSVSLVIKEVKLAQRSDLENQARKIRFEYFDSLINDYKISKIVLGHNKNDVIETMLLHLFRGAGITGMKGIQPCNNNLIRPLLCFSREEIVEYLSNCGIKTWRQDSSNLDNIFSRNKLRNELIPWLENNMNERIVDLLYQNSLIFKEADDFLRNHVAMTFKKMLIGQTTNEIRLDLTRIASKKRIIIFYILRRCLNILTGSETGFYHKHLKDICAIMTAEGNKMLKLPDGITVLKEYDQLVFLRKDKTEKLNDKKKERQLIDINKKFHIFDNNRLLIKRVSPNDLTKSYYEDKNTALIDPDKISLPLSVGYREEGERFIPLGMTGTKKLKDFFIDEKISKFERGRVLIFRDKEKIIWLAGLRIDNRVRLTEQTESVLVIRVENIARRNRKSILKKKKDRGKKDDQRHFSDFIG